MHLKRYFHNDPFSEFSEAPSFTPKSPKSHPSLEVFLSEMEKKIFAVPASRLGYSNLSQGEWQAM